MSIALNEEHFVLAVVAPLDTFMFETGVQLEVLAMLKGEFPPDLLRDGQVHADVRSVVSCFPFRLYRQGEVVLAMISLSHGQASTLSGWPLVSETGAPLARSSIAAATLQPDALNALNVKLPDETTTVGALLQAGRDYVAPTATPFPPGYKTPIAPDSGDGASGLQPPATGSRSASDGQDRRSMLTVVGIAAAAVALLGAGVLVRARLRHH